MGVLLGFEDFIDVKMVIHHSIWMEKELAIEYMRKGFSPVAMLHYIWWKRLSDVYRIIRNADSHSFAKWSRIDWF